MPGSIRLGRIAGIDIYINFSWLIILVFLTWSLATGWFTVYRGWSVATYWIMSLIAATKLERRLALDGESRCKPVAGCARRNARWCPDARCHYTYFGGTTWSWA
jgi:hypothetical protein